jgi:hypothetical protein
MHEIFRRIWAGEQTEFSYADNDQWIEGAPVADRVECAKRLATVSGADLVFDGEIATARGEDAELCLSWASLEIDRHRLEVLDGGAHRGPVQRRVPTGASQNGTPLGDLGMRR